MASTPKAIEQRLPCRYRKRCGSICSHARAGSEPAAPASLDCVMAHRRQDLIRFLFLACVLALIGGAGAYQYSTSVGFAALKQASETRLARQASILERQIDKFGLLPLSRRLIAM